MFATLALLITISTLHCDESIINAVEGYKLKIGASNHELFLEFDLDHNNCIDSSEMNTLIKKIGVPWRCQWTNKIIATLDVNTQDDCIEWSEFTTVIEHAQ